MKNLSGQAQGLLLPDPSVLLAVFHSYAAFLFKTHNIQYITVLGCEYEKLSI
jgi:hypothetical protein